MKTLHIKNTPFIPFLSFVTLFSCLQLFPMDGDKPGPKKTIEALDLALPSKENPKKKTRVKFQKPINSNKHPEKKKVSQARISRSAYSQLQDVMPHSEKALHNMTEAHRDMLASLDMPHATDAFKDAMHAEREYKRKKHRETYHRYKLQPRNILPKYVTQFTTVSLEPYNQNTIDSQKPISLKQLKKQAYRSMRTAQEAADAFSLQSDSPAAQKARKKAAEAKHHYRRLFSLSSHANTPSNRIKNYLKKAAPETKPTTQSLAQTSQTTIESMQFEQKVIPKLPIQPMSDQTKALLELKKKALQDFHATQDIAYRISDSTKEVLAKIAEAENHYYDLCDQVRKSEKEDRIKCAVHTIQRKSGDCNNYEGKNSKFFHMIFLVVKRYTIFL